MKVKLSTIVILDFLLLLIIFVQSLYLSYRKEGEFIFIWDRFKDIDTSDKLLFEILNVIKSFTHYEDITYNLYFVIIILTLITSIIPFFFGRRIKKMHKTDLLFQKNMLLLNIIVNIFIIVYNNIYTDLWFDTDESRKKNYSFIITPVSLLLYIIVTTYFIKRFSLFDKIWLFVEKKMKQEWIKE